MLFLGGTLQHARVGEDDGCIFITVGHAIDHDAVELTRLQVFLLHIEVAVWNAVIEDSFWDFQFRTLLLHGEQELSQFLVGTRAYVVLEIE